MRLTVDNLTYYNPSTLNLLLRGNSLVTKAKSALSISGNEIIYNPTSAEKTALGDGVVYVQLKTDSMQTEIVKITALDLDGTIMKPFALAYTPLKNSDAFDSVDMLDTCRGLDRGLYYFKATCTNRPTNINGRGYACAVNRRASGSSEYIQLIATDYYDGKTYTNIFHGSTWLGWSLLNSDDFVLKSGDTMAGALAISKNGTVNLQVKNTGTNAKTTDLLCDASNGYSGLYDRTFSQWMIYSDVSGNIIIPSLPGISGSYANASHNNSFSVTTVLCGGFIYNSSKTVVFLIPYNVIGGTASCSALSIRIYLVSGGNPYFRSGGSGGTYTQDSSVLSIWANNASVRTNEVDSVTVTTKAGSGLQVQVVFKYAMTTNNSGTAVLTNAPVVLYASGTFALS